MITTVSTVKTLLNITDSSYDTRIAMLLPMVENDLIEYCNNAFLNTGVVFSGDIELKVAAGPVYTMECDDGGYSTSGLAIDDIVYLTGSTRNDHYFTIDNLTDTVITVDEKIYAEAETGLTLTLVEFPTELQMYVAQMIWHKLDAIKSAGMQSENIKSYSYTRASGGASDAGYPQEILRGLEKWKRIKVGRGRRIEHYSDKRGSFIPSELDI